MDVQAQVILGSTGGAAENAVTNTWAFTNFTAGDEVACTTALKGFYDGITSTNWSSALSIGPHTVNWYEKPGVKPNYPFAITSFSRVGAPNGVPLPSEVAICLSFQGAKAAGAPQARRRGRVYLGPLGAGANTSGVVTPALLTSIAAAATAFKAAVLAIPSTVEWAVWSTVDQHAVVVTNGWVDNAFDIQRRRGIDASSRTTFT